MSARFRLALVIAVSLVWRTVQSVAENGDVDDIETILNNARNYNKNAYPTQFIDKPTTVTIQMYIEGMSSFRAQSMDFQVDIYFQEQWLDERLRHNGTRRILIKDPHLFNLIWHPDLYFANARTAEFHHVTSPNFLVWIYPNGTVWYDCRISLTVICMQNLARYPLDSQSCTLRILSYAYDYEQLLITWNGRNPVETNEEIRMPDMRLRHIKPGLRNDTYATGVWSCATAEFHVDREIMHHILQSYVPTSLIVVISWFSFWLDVEAVPGRVSLSITTLLTLATQSSAARMALPQASYVKAIDVWMGACMTFVFSAMIEFTVVNYCCRRKPKEKKPGVNGLTAQVQQLIEDYTKQKPFGCCYPNMMESSESAENIPLEKSPSYEMAIEGEGTQVQNVLLEKKTIRDMRQNPYALREGSQLRMLSSKKRKRIEERLTRVEENRKLAQLIDRRSRVYFPVVFVIFNLFYWIYYVKYANDDL